MLGRHLRLGAATRREGTVSTKYRVASYRTGRILIRSYGYLLSSYLPYGRTVEFELPYARVRDIGFEATE